MLHHPLHTPSPIALAVVGGGPAGLRAAECVSHAGFPVHLFDAKPSVGRKFLVAGRGGLNLTKAEPLETFASHYTSPDAPPTWWHSVLADFDPDASRTWAASLGVETFVASTRRVYPSAMRAAPLLRRWVERLRQQGVLFSMRHRLTSIEPSEHNLTLCFETPAGPSAIRSRAAILALGGASWPETGSDGTWINTMRSAGLQVRDLVPSNCGWECTWPPDLLAHIEGKPLKALSVSAGSFTVQGELLVTRYGLEGGALYALAPALRAMELPSLSIDFKPHSSKERLLAKMGPIRQGPRLLAEAQQRLRLSNELVALLTLLPPLPHLASVDALIDRIKAFPIALQRPRPIAEAISSAGGLAFSELSEQLMLRKIPGLFAAGEMLDWDAPTGGYLLQGCLATGTRAARGAIRWLQHSIP